MADTKNYRIGVDYKLYTVGDNGERVLEEETTKDVPFRYLSGFAMTLDKFEEETVGLNVGDTFDFTIEKEDAYGDYFADRVLDLSKDMFSVDGKFDAENIKVGAIVPLQNEDGARFFGHVLEITDTTVKMDLNHPLVGRRLNFVGCIVEKIEASAQEIQAMMSHLAGEGGCGSCGGGCHGGDCGSCDGGCGGCK